MQDAVKKIGGLGLTFEVGDWFMIEADGKQMRCEVKRKQGNGRRFMIIFLDPAKHFTVLRGKYLEQKEQENAD